MIFGRRVSRLLLVAFALSLLVHLIVAVALHPPIPTAQNQAEVVSIEHRPASIAMTKMPTPPPPRPLHTPYTFRRWFSRFRPLGDRLDDRLFRLHEAAEAFAGQIGDVAVGNRRHHLRRRAGRFQADVYLPRCYVHQLLLHIDERISCLACQIGQLRLFSLADHDFLAAGQGRHLLGDDV